MQPAPNGRSSAKGRGGASPIPRAEDGSCAGGVLATLLQSASTRLSVCAAASSYCWQPPLNPASACAGGLHMPLASRQSLSIRAAPASGRVRAGPVSDFASDPWRSLTNAEGPPCTGRSPTAAVAVLRVTEGRSCLKWLQLPQLEDFMTLQSRTPSLVRVSAASSHRRRGRALRNRIAHCTRRPRCARRAGRRPSSPGTRWHGQSGAHLVRPCP